MQITSSDKLSAKFQKDSMCERSVWVMVLIDRSHREALKLGNAILLSEKKPETFTSGGY